MYTFFFDLAKLCKRKHLEPAGICQYRSLPVHKLMQTAELFDDLIARADMQMISIGKLHLCSDLIKILCRNGTFDRTDRSHIHKHRRLDRAMHSLKLRTLRTPLRFH